MKKLTAIKNLLTVELADHELVDINNYYQDKVNGDTYIYSIDEFDELMNGKTPSEIANMVSYGDYNPFRMWMWFNGCGNVVTSDYPCDCNGCDVDAIAEYAIDNDEDFDNDEIREILDDENEEYEE